MTPTRRPGPRSFRSRFFSVISIFFDREIPIALDGLFEVGQQDDLTFYAETAEGPHDRLFVSSAVDAESVARYLPEIPVGADGTPLADACPAQPQEFGDLKAGKGSMPTPVPSRTSPWMDSPRLPRPPRDSPSTPTRRSNRLSIC